MTVMLWLLLLLQLLPLYVHESMKEYEYTYIYFHKFLLFIKILLLKFLDGTWTTLIPGAILSLNLSKNLSKKSIPVVMWMRLSGQF